MTCARKRRDYKKKRYRYIITLVHLFILNKIGKK